MNILTIGNGKNHNFGKLVDGVLELAPTALIIEDKQYIGNNATRYVNAGYLPITYTDKPEDTETGHYEAVYTETDGTIVQSWEFVSNIPNGYLDTSKITNFSYWFAANARAETIDHIDTSNGDCFQYFFYAARKGYFPNEKIPYEKINTSKGEFFNCFMSESDIDELPDYFIDTSNGRYMQGFFEYCESLKKAPMLNTAKNKEFQYFCRNCSNLLEVPQLDTSSGEKFDYMFAYCDALQTVGELDTSNGTTFTYMFKACKALKNVPQLDTSKGTDFTYMIDACYALTEIPSFDTSNGTTFTNAFSNNTGVVTIGELDLTNATNIDNLFRNGYALETLSGLTFNSMPTSKMSTNIFYKCKKIKNINITGTIKVDSNHLTLAHCPNLTVESMLSILNALEDNTGGTRYTVYFGSSNISKLTDEQQQMAEDKNISLG